MTRQLPISRPGARVWAIACLWLVASLSFGAAPVLGAGDDIRVISDEREVRFPGDVVFNLELDGVADIVEVRLYYRVSPSGAWAYTYPSLTHSRRVEATFNLNLSGVSYLPPGTELEYYYSILDSQGNTLDTRPETFVYVDDRFEWHSLDAGPLTIFWHDLPEERVKGVAHHVEKSLGEISELLQLSAQRPLRGIVYNSPSEAAEVFPHQSQTITQEQVFQGFAFPERGVFVGLGLHSRLIVHESAHLLLRQATASPRAKIPSWVNEGFASHVEPGTNGYKTGFPRGALPELMPLRHMYGIPGRPEAIRYFYRKAESVVGYLMETYTDEEFRTFLAQLNDGKNADVALTSAYGFGLDELDRRWASAVTKRGGGDFGGGTSLIINLNTLLIGIVVLAVVGIIVANFVTRRMKKKAEGPDVWNRLTEDEWQGRP